MKRRALLSFVAFPAAVKALAADPTKPAATKPSETWLAAIHPKFVMAYYFGDAGPQDLRPATKGDPFQKNGEKYPPPDSIINGEPIDVANLVARVKARVPLDEQDFKHITQALFDGSTEARIFECYDPHHVIVGYSHSGSPVCAIEICFHCQGIHTYPKNEAVIYECQDLRTVARLLSKAGLPLGKDYPTLADYEKDWEARLRPDKK